MSASNEEINALLRRADALKDQDGAPEWVRAFWRGYAKSLRDLQSGAGKKAAAKDSAAQHRTGMRQRANAALPVDSHRFAAADMPEFVTTENVEVANHLIVDFKVNAVQQLEHDKLIALVAHDKQAVPAADAHNISACHESSGVVAGSIAQGHSAAAHPEGVKDTGGAP
ncbi:hypothetical protein [Variovorax boronicumulans]|uniref:hypothetical protein n=1 Tax=Variovorax boronicumulans TaxID=436515 RepID=UPI0012FDEA1F|nr:hypothetical protein [Variovorax boronicumulans]